MAKRKNHSPEFKAEVSLEAIREEMTLAELSKKHGVHPNMISTWKRAAISNMSSAFERGKSDDANASEVEIEKLHSKIGQLVVGRDFLADASHQLLGTRGKKWLANAPITPPLRPKRRSRPPKNGVRSL